MTDQESTLLTYLGWRETNFVPMRKRPVLTVGETYVTSKGKEVMCAQSEYDENGENPTIFISCETGWVFIAYGAQVYDDGVRVMWTSVAGGHHFGDMPFDHYFAEYFIDGLPWEQDDRLRKDEFDEGWYDKKTGEWYPF